MNWEECGKEWSWYNFKLLARSLPGGTEYDQVKPQDNRSPGLDLNVSPPKMQGGNVKNCAVTFRVCNIVAVNTAIA
jgi:hypothetical protein